MSSFRVFAVLAGLSASSLAVLSWRSTTPRDTLASAEVEGPRAEAPRPVPPPADSATAQEQRPHRAVAGVPPLRNQFHGLRPVAEVLPNLAVTIGDWRTFAPSMLSVSPVPELPLEFEVTQVTREERHTTLFGRSALGARLVAVGSAGAWLAKIELPGVAEFNVFVRDGSASVLEIPARELACAATVGRAQARAQQSSASGGLTASSEIPTIDVAVFYDSAAEAVVRRITSDAHAAHEYLELETLGILATGNAVLHSSGIENFRWRMLGLYRVPEYPSTGQMDEDLERFTDASTELGAFAQRVADAVGADQEMLIVGDHYEYGGMAWVPGTKSVVSANSGWVTTIHELGHNFGCHHDRLTKGAADSDGKYHYGHAFHTWGGNPTRIVRVGTVMSYAEFVMPYFSTPERSTDVSSAVGGRSWGLVYSMGVAEDQPRAANNARIVRENAAGLIATRTRKLSAPAIVSEPISQLRGRGANAYLSVSAVGGDLHYQWRKNGVAISGANTAVLSLRTLGDETTGYYDCVVSNTQGSVTSARATVFVDEPTAKSRSRLVNISTRSYVGTGHDVQIAGIAIRGDQPQRLLIRASGPALHDLGVPGALADPVLTIKSGDTTLHANDDWSSDGALVNELEATFSKAGAFAFKPGSKDAALVVTLPPGNYTALVEGKNGGSGVALVEIYDVDQAGSKLVNLSTRSLVKTGAAVQIAGFVIVGPDPKRVLIRASGPALSNFGLSGFLPDPQLQLFRGGAPLFSNDNWAADDLIAFQKETISQKAGAFDWTSGSKDSSLVVTLEPGVYSAMVSGVADVTGIALIEVYEVN